MPKKELRFGVSDGAGRRAATWKLARGKRVRAISVDEKARRGYNPIVPKRERKLELLLVAATGSAR